MSSTQPSGRLAYIDWLRGLACVVMFQTHCYDAWLSPEARKSQFFLYSRLGGTLPAPIFLFLAGVSVALVSQKLLHNSATANQIGITTIRRGAQVLGFGLLFRLQEYLISWGWAPWSDLFRVDILNTIGVSMLLMGVFCWLMPAPRGVWLGGGSIPLAVCAAAVSLGISLLSPVVWATSKLHWLPWPLESYLNGVHNTSQPQSYLFPIFPWAGFAFAGLAVGFFLFSEWGKQRESSAVGLLSAASLGLITVSHFLARWRAYAGEDYWHASPSFFLLRVGILLLVLASAHAWCRWGAGCVGFSPLVQLGKTSLLVYWVHIEFVYGRVSILPRGAEGIAGASLGLLVICGSMLLLSLAQTSRRKRVKTGVEKAPLSQAKLGMSSLTN